MKSKIHPKYATDCRLNNWAEYDEALVRRGDITLWISDDAIESWKPAPTGRRGAQRKFSDHAIETALTLRLVFILPLRQTESFLRSVLPLGVEVVVSPSKSATRSRRKRSRSSARDRTIIRVKEIGRRQWKKESGYHRQARVEGTFFRYKTILGPRLRARNRVSQQAEAIIACSILNRMTTLGKPESFAIGA